MTVAMTLAEKVVAMMDGDEGMPPGAIVDKAGAVPYRSDDEHEYALADWHMYYGIAVGLARTDEPCESLDSVARRARAAACEAFLRLDEDRVGAVEVRDALTDSRREAVA